MDNLHILVYINIFMFGIICAFIRATMILHSSDNREQLSVLLFSIVCGLVWPAFLIAIILRIIFDPNMRADIRRLYLRLKYKV